ncbi:hypothetical protein KM043_017426 [Ampulex compressa]|nr:hypothetical protein KM043_017426 [Ampulex compressa]
MRWHCGALRQDESSLQSSGSDGGPNPRQDSENGSLFSQALTGAGPILAALCFLKQRAHFLIATPEKKGESEGGRWRYGTRLKRGRIESLVPRCLPKAAFSFLMMTTLGFS